MRTDRQVGMDVGKVNECMCIPVVYANAILGWNVRMFITALC